MGLYDRDYFRDEQPSGISLGTQPMVIKIILVTVALYLVNMFTSDALFNFMDLRLNQAWQVWRFVTYGFAHDPQNLLHIAINMFMLWMFGRTVEMVLGPKEFLRFYLLAIVFGGVSWAVAEKLMGNPGNIPMLGASGGIAGVFIFFVLKFPQQDLFLLFIPIPIKAWVIGLVVVGIDAISFVRDASGMSASHVAHMAHLGGAAAALAYVKLGWNLGRVPPFAWTSGLKMPKLRRQPKLRLHEPDDTPEPVAMGEEVDRILEKITQQGEDSLTSEERRTLSEASRRYQRRRG